MTKSERRVTYPDSTGTERAAPLRVLQVTARYSPYIGGVESHVEQVSRRLAHAGVEVTVLTTDTSGKLPSHEQRDGVHIRRVRAWPANRDYYFAPDVYRTICQKNWDLIHVQCYHTLVPPIAMLAALRTHTPYVVTFHGGGHSSRLRNAARQTQRAFLRPLLANATRLVAIAEFEIKLYGHELHIPAERFILIPNGADLPSIHPVSAAARDGGTLIASVGRLERYKGHQRILSAMPSILREQPDARLWIAGSGPYEKNLHQLAAKLGITERVEIRAVPSSEREAMATELSKAAVVVLLSDYETHPIAALEALSLGKPVVVADTSGMAELARRGMARAIPLSSSPDQVAAAVLEQVRQPLKPANLALPTWEECTNKLIALYQSICRAPLCES